MDALKLHNVFYQIKFFTKATSVPVSQITFALMSILMQIVFWGSALALAHTYLLYPWLMRLFASGKSGNNAVFSREDAALPRVSVLMSVYNEERVIREKLDSLRRLNYPVEKIRVYLGSDCSDDATHSLIEQYVREHPSKNIRFFPFATRRGKPPVINDLARHAFDDARLSPAGDPPVDHVFLLTDASVMLEPDTLYGLVRHFRNPDIGVVDAHMQSRGLRAEGISRSEGTYLGREVRLKHWEGQAWGMMMGPFGGCYAIRAELYEPIPPRSLVDDFWLVFRALEKGYRAINDLEAVCQEGATHRVRDEYRRKKRIAAGSFQNLMRFRRWILPPFSRLGFAFFSHKVLRWFGGFFLAAMLFSSAVLAIDNHFFRVLFGLMASGIALVYLMDYGLRLTRWRLFFPVKNATYFLTMNLALIDGFFKWMRGIRENTWQRTARE